eukprot:450502_1
MTESKEVSNDEKTEDWLQFYDNTPSDDDEDKSQENKSQEKKDKKFNTTNIEGIKYSPYKLTFSNKESDKESIQLYSTNDISQIIKDYKLKYNSKFCSTCGKHFQTYSDRDIHNSQRLMRTSKACKPIFNINNYDKTKIDKSFHSQLSLYIHFSEQRLNKVKALNSLICIKLKDEIELLYSNIFSTDIDNNKYLCFAIPIFCFESVNKHIYFAEITNYDLEIWYEKLFSENRDYTPQSKYIPLEKDELDALQELRLSHRFRSSLKPDINNILSRLTRKLNRIIGEFRQELSKDEKFNRNIFSIDEYFFKLSTRSPKDGTGINYKTYPNTTRLERIILIMEKMKIKQADEIMELIQKSERVFSDIGFYHHYYISFAHPLNLIIRTFFKRLNPIFEFRCFIKGKQLNAISQYLCYDIFNELHNVKLCYNIRNHIIKFHQNVKNVLPYDDYVMDVFVDILNDEKTKMKVYIIEINPFGACSSSGSALFEWKLDFDLLYGNINDKKILPVFRVAKRDKNKQK